MLGLQEGLVEVFMVSKVCSGERMDGNQESVRVAEGMKTESYFVLDCPEFVHDEVRDEID